MLPPGAGRGGPHTPTDGPSRRLPAAEPVALPQPHDLIDVFSTGEFPHDPRVSRRASSPLLFLHLATHRSHASAARRIRGAAGADLDQVGLAAGAVVARFRDRGRGGVGALFPVPGYRGGGGSRGGLVRGLPQRRPPDPVPGHRSLALRRGSHRPRSSSRPGLRLGDPAHDGGAGGHDPGPALWGLARGSHDAGVRGWCGTPGG